MAKGKSKNNEDEAFWESITSEPEPPVACELCGRTDANITEHHLIPKSRHDKARTKREFSRSEMKSGIAMLCEACHDQVHEVFTNQELSSYYHTVERLAEHSEMAKFINWVKKRPGGQTIRVKSGKAD